MLSGKISAGLEREFEERVDARSRMEDSSLTRHQVLAIARTVWRDAGAIKTEHIRTQFMRITRKIGIPECTSRRRCGTTLQRACRMPTSIR